VRSNPDSTLARVAALVAFAVLIALGFPRTGAADVAPGPGSIPPAASPVEGEGEGEGEGGEADNGPDSGPVPGPGSAASGIGARGLPGVSDNPPGDGGNPYRAIVARNAFRLKDPLPPPPPPTNPPAPPETPKVDVKLSGMGTISGVRWAYFAVPDPKRQGQFNYLSLTDDPKKGSVRHSTGLEVKEIDLKSKSVRVINGGMEVALNFKDHGLKSAAQPAAPGRPGAVPVPGATPGVNVVRPPTTTVVPAAGSAAPPAPEAQPVVFSRRGNRAANEGTGSALPATGINAPLPVGGGVSGTTPTVNFPTRPVRSEVANPAAIPQIPIEHQYEILLKQRQAYDAVGVPLPPIPGLPTPTPTPTP
jgi:hypothetical protein